MDQCRSHHWMVINTFYILLMIVQNFNSILLKAIFGTFNAFKTYKSYGENQCQIKIRTNNDDEYFSQEWTKLFHKHKIRHDHTIAKWSR